MLLPYEDWTSPLLGSPLDLRYLCLILNVFLSGITPTPLGEGKSTTTIGLAQVSQLSKFLIYVNMQMLRLTKVKSLLFCFEIFCPERKNCAGSIGNKSSKEHQQTKS